MAVLVQQQQQEPRPQNRSGCSFETPSLRQPGGAKAIDTPAAAMVVAFTPYLENGTSLVRDIQYTSANWAACANRTAMYSEVPYSRGTFQRLARERISPHWRGVSSPGNMGQPKE